MLFVFYVFGFLYREPNLYLAFGFELSAQQPALIGILLVSQYVFAPYNELMSVIMSFMTRRFGKIEGFIKILQTIFRIWRGCLRGAIGIRLATEHWTC